jgi:hypothetical protein
MSMALRVKGMTDEKKDEFIRLINDKEQDFAKACVIAATSCVGA